MRAIKQALTERWYSWEDARELAKNDAEIKLLKNRVQYEPQEFMADIPSEALPSDSPVKQTESSGATGKADVQHVAAATEEKTVAASTAREDAKQEATARQKPT